MDAPVDIQAAADVCLRTLATLSPAGAVNNALHFCKEPWVSEAWRRRGGLEASLVGVYWLWGSDDETRYPAAVVKIHRTPWRAGQMARTAYLALYYSEERDWSVVCFDRLIEERRLSGWPPEL